MFDTSYLSRTVGFFFALHLALLNAYCEAGKVEQVAKEVAVVANSDEELPTPLQLYRDYLKESGGLAHLAELKSLKMSGYMLLGQGATKVDFSIYRKKPKMLRMRTEFPSYYTETVFDGKVGVRRHFDPADNLIQSDELSDVDLENLERSSTMDGLFQQLSRDLDEIESISWDEVNGVPAIRLQLVAENQLGYHQLWLNRETLQECKVSRVLKDEETGNETLEETYFSEMDHVDGYFFPRLSQTFLNGELQQEVHIEGIRLNAGLFDSFFSIR